MRYATPAALRQAIDARLAEQARSAGVPATRLRRRMAFERVLARLAANDPGRWVLKGAMALEARWLDRARATKDIDLATSHEISESGGVRNLILRVLAEDPDRDRFQFEIDRVEPISADLAGRPGWRAGIRASLAGRRFSEFKIDIVARTDELAATELVRLPGALSFAEISVREIEAADLAQHFAEKVHALTRTYSGGRPSTRVRDLVDLVLILEEQPPDPGAAHRAMEHVFAARATHAIPIEIADPPPPWSRVFSDLAGELGLSVDTLDEGIALVRNYWQTINETHEDNR